MSDPLFQEACALALFAGLHFGAPHPPVRRRLVAALGEKPYQGVFTLAALASLTWAVIAFNGAPRLALWETPYAWRYVAMAVNAFAYVLLACSLMTPNPTAAGMDGRVPLRAHAIFSVTRHPMMWGIGLWALTHVISSGHVAALLLFGTLGFVALFGALHQEQRKRADRGEEWEAFVAGTSYLPFAAILAGRARVTLGEIGWIRIGTGLVVFATTLLFHEFLSGFDLLESQS